MVEARLEHVNITVSDPKATAETLCALFDWKVRWSGEAKDNGVTYHVGSDESYLAIYSKGGRSKAGDSYVTPGAMNHIGVVVADIDAVEERVKSAGYNPHMHSNYEPGVRFYFYGPDNVEIEVVSYVQ